jgi:hypothetical protein
MVNGGDTRPVVRPMGVTRDGDVHGAPGEDEWGLPPEDDEVIAVVAREVGSLRGAGTHVMAGTAVPVERPQVVGP